MAQMHHICTISRRKQPQEPHPLSIFDGEGAGGEARTLGFSQPSGASIAITHPTPRKAQPSMVGAALAVALLVWVKATLAVALLVWVKATLAAHQTVRKSVQERFLALLPTEDHKRIIRGDGIRRRCDRHRRVEFAEVYSRIKGCCYTRSRRSNQ